MSESFTLKFWGVRGSYPVAQREMLGVGGNTASVEIATPYARILFDAGTGIIPLGQEIMRHAQTPLVLLLSHWHHDHLQGLPFFAPLFRPNTSLTIAAPAHDENDLAEKLRNVMSPPQFPVEWNATRAAKTLLPLPQNTTLYLDTNGALSLTPRGHSLTVRVFHSSAHPNGSTLYRVEYRGVAIVYATDVESDASHASAIVEFARGATLLIHDAQYQRAHYLGQPPFAISTHGFGHSTNEMAAAIARAAHVKQLVLFHHDPNYSDDTIARIQTQTRALFGKTIAAREGTNFKFVVPSKGASHVTFAPLDASAA